MNHDVRGEIFLVAIVLSVGIHFGMMYYARPRVMTHVVSESVRTTHREAMRVTKQSERPDPVRIDVIEDVDALKDAPVAESVKEMPPAPQSGETTPTGAKAVLPAALADLADSPKPMFEKATLDVKPLSVERSSFKITLPPQAVSSPQVARLEGAPSSAPIRPTVDVASLKPALPPVTSSSDGVFGPAKLLPVKEKASEEEKPFKPEEEVREKVDEKLVEKEKEAVKDLLDVSNAIELKKLVNAAIVRTVSGGWTYFKVMLSPRNDLQVVPKDVVLLIDASGSIGKDRIRSVREAAKGILRSCTNSGDRFNLVAFRDRYTYAFRRWQECTQSSFDEADKWLGNVAAHGRTDVFASIRSVLTLPRDPSRPLIALVITDGDANSGVSETSEILSKFTTLNDGLVSVYMYGVKGSANRELIDVLTHGNRGESFIYDGWRWSAGSGIEGLGERFRDPVLSDLRLVFAADTKAESYPRLLRNLYRGDTLEIVGRVPAGVKTLSFSLKGLNGKEPYEGFFSFPLDAVGEDPSAVKNWNVERNIDLKLR